MEITKYTLEIDSGEMFELAYALEHYIDSNITIIDNAKTLKILNDFEIELRLLNTFVDSFGYSLSVSKKTKEGYTMHESKTKYYDNAEEWFDALLKQRVKESKVNN